MNPKLKEIIRKNKLIPILTIILFITIISISSVSANERTITNTTTGGINQAVNDANANDIIYLENGIYNKYNESDKDYNITITKNLTFIGNGSNVIIDAQGKDRIFTIPWESDFVTANFINITFRNGLSNGGSAFYSIDSKNSLNFNNCTFINNSETQYGGGAINCAGNLSVINSRFINNTSKYLGGAISQGTFNDETIFNVENSYFENNNAEIEGGAIYSWDNNAMIKNSTFINNSADSSGGAISIYASVYNVTVKNSIFINNKVTNESGNGYGLGGAISNSGYGSVFENLIFESNSAPLGGAIMNNGEDYCIIRNSSFIDNFATNTGGAVYNGHSNPNYAYLGSNLTISNSNFLNNRANNDGGAIYIVSADNLTFKYNRFYNNSGYDLYNFNGTNVNADFNWWGYNNLDNNNQLLFNVTSSNHYVLVIVNDSSLDGVVWGDKLLFSFLVLNTTNDSSGVDYLPDFNGNGTFNNNPFNTTSNSSFLNTFLVANPGLHALKITLDGEEDELFFDALKQNLTMDIDFPNGGVGDYVNLNLSLNDSVNLTTNITWSIEGLGSFSSENITFTDGNSSLWYEIAFPYTGEINVTFNGTELYNTYFTSINVDFSKGNLSISAVVNNGSFGDNITVNLSLNRSINTTANVTVNGVVFNEVNFIDGNATLNYTITAPFNGDILIEFNGNDLYYSCNVNVPVNFIKRQLNITATIPKGIYGENVTVDLELNETVDVVSNLTIGDQNFTNVNFVGGLASVNYTITQAGEYNLNIFFNGSSNYNNCSNITVVSFDKRQLNITAIIMGGVYGENITAILVLNETVNITSNVTIGNQEFMNVRFVNGNGSINYTVNRAGEYGLIVKFMETDNYSNCSNETFVNFAKRQLNITATIPRGVYGENVTAILVLNEMINVTSNVSIGSQEFIGVRFVNGNGSVNYTVDRAGGHGLIVKFMETDNYSNCSNETFVDFDKRPLNITAIIPNGAYGENVTVHLELNEPVDLVSNISIRSQNFTNVRFTNGISSVNYTIDRMGEYTLTIIFYGNENYNNCSNTTDVNFDMKALNITAIVPNGTYGDNIKINLTLNESINIISNVTIGNQKFNNVRFVNGNAIVDYEINNAYTGDLKIIFEGNENYTTASYETSVNFAKKSLKISASIIGGVYGENINVALELNESVNVTSNISIDNQDFSNVNFINGKANISYFIDRAGSYSLNIVFDGTDNYNPCSNITVVDFAKRPLNISASIPTGAYGDTVKVNLSLNESINIKSNVSIGNQKFNNVDFVNGLCSVDYIVDSVYSGDLTIIFEGNENYSNDTSHAFADFTKADSNIIVNFNPNGSNYGDTIILNATILDNNGNPLDNVKLVFYINNMAVGYNYTNTEGIAILDYLINFIGDYNLTVCFEGNENYTNSSSNVSGEFKGAYTKSNSTVIINSNNNGSKYDEDIIFNATVLDENDNPLDNVVVEFYINGNLIGYNTTDSNGIAILNFNVNFTGKYQLNIIFNGDKNYNSNSNSVSGEFIKANAIINVKTIPKNIDIGNKLTIKGNLTDKDGKLLNGKYNLKIKVNTGKSYIYTVEVIDGLWNLTINNPKLGITNIEVNLDTNPNYNLKELKKITYNVVKIKTTITVSAPKITLGKKTNIVITLKDHNGKAIKGKKITITSKYLKKPFTATTNSKGQIAIRIYISKAGKYTGIAKFTGDSTYLKSQKT
ncbi:MAG: hypothetical protein LBM96_08675, partial [Methanobrevibacter sp.]|nr:hypothetical protein [Candidatus Methanoflexus mossambicus]